MVGKQPERFSKPELARTPETVYTGISHGSYHDNEIFVEDELLDSRTDLDAVPPDKGFIWGYTGSGPYITSLSLLADAYDSDEVAQEYAMAFKNRYVGPELDIGEDFEITAKEIDDVVESIYEDWI